MFSPAGYDFLVKLFTLYHKGKEKVVQNTESNIKLIRQFVQCLLKIKDTNLIQKRVKHGINIRNPKNYAEEQKDAENTDCRG